MSRHQDDPLFQTLFSEQARFDIGKAPDFDRVLGRPCVQSRLSAGRLTATAGLMLVLAVGVPLVHRSVTATQRPPQVALPNLLEGLDEPSMLSWQSPTAFLLDLSIPAGAQSAPPPNQNLPASRHSNG
jgi:hypothetical protein